MVLFRWLRFTGQVEEFRPVEADSLRTMLEGVINIFGEFDVRLNTDDVPVFGLGRQFGQFPQLSLKAFEFLGRLAVLFELLRVGVNDYYAAGAIDDYRIPAADLGGQIAKADYRRNAHCTGNDRGVARSPTHVCRKTPNVIAVERRRLRGEQVVGNHDHIAGQVKQVFVLLADQGAENPPLDVVDVGHAGGEI